MKKDTASSFRCFVAISYSPDFDELRVVIKKSIRDAGFRYADTGEVFNSGLMSDILIGEISRSDCIVADISGSNRNVFYELGLAQAMGKALYIIVREEEQSSIPVDLRGFQYLTYQPTSSGYSELGSKLADGLRRFQDIPRSPRVLGRNQINRPFIVDWDRLDDRDIDNLIFELLSQLGFKSIQWNIGSDYFELSAELFKNDPDGFAYKELWLATLGRNEKIDRMLDMPLFDPNFLRYEILDRSYKNKSFELDSNTISLLFILVSNVSPFMQERLNHYESRRSERMSKYGNVRIRIWDRSYLTSLVQQFPQIGYKYFSEEGRSLTKYRKTPEELIRENSELTDRLVTTIEALKEEKNKRVRAERDAVWKDISFSAAHKIGNPIFAIETDLNPLRKRVDEGRYSDVFEVIDNMQSSVEKAKAIVDQFKSLSKAQDVKLDRILLRPIIEDALCNSDIHSVSVVIDCDPKIEVLADAEKLSECFDELFANSLNWFDKSEKIINIKVNAENGNLPAELDTSFAYAKINYRDNGIGIHQDLKNQIFNPFFTTRDQGTGLGLALVRRVIEEHGGLILENGIPKVGASFDVYLRLPAKSKLKKNTKSKANME